jgi:hypothetical protein
MPGTPSGKAFIYDIGRAGGGGGGYSGMGNPYADSFAGDLAALNLGWKAQEQERLQKGFELSEEREKRKEIEEQRRYEAQQKRQDFQEQIEKRRMDHQNFMEKKSYDLELAKQKHQELQEKVAADKEENNYRTGQLSSMLELIDPTASDAHKQLEEIVSSDDFKKVGLRQGGNMLAMQINKVKSNIQKARQAEQAKADMDAKIQQGWTPKTFTDANGVSRTTLEPPKVIDYTKQAKEFETRYKIPSAALNVPLGAKAGSIQTMRGNIVDGAFKADPEGDYVRAVDKTNPTRKKEALIPFEEFSSAQQTMSGKTKSGAGMAGGTAFFPSTPLPSPTPQDTTEQPAPQTQRYIYDPSTGTLNPQQ